MKRKILSFCYLELTLTIYLMYKCAPATFIEKPPKRLKGQK